MLKNNNAIESGKLAFGGIAPVPWHEEQLDNKLKGLVNTEETILRFTDSILEKADPLEMNKYKIPLTRNLTRKVLAEIMEKA